MLNVENIEITFAKKRKQEVYRKINENKITLNKTRI
jgi:hypothetical protein